MNATYPIAAAEQAVCAALARFNAAAKVGDAAALDALLAAELMYSHSNAKVENKAECIAALVRSNIGLSTPRRLDRPGLQRRNVRHGPRQDGRAQPRGRNRTAPLYDDVGEVWRRLAAGGPAHR